MGPDIKTFSWFVEGILLVNNTQSYQQQQKAIPPLGIKEHSNNSEI